MNQKLKKAHKSKTIQFAAALAVLGVIETQFHLVESLVPEQYRGLILVGVGMAVAYLRVVTTTSLDNK